MAKDTVQLTLEQYRKFVAVQYLNASTFLYDGLKLPTRKELRTNVQSAAHLVKQAALTLL